MRFRHRKRASRSSRDSHDQSNIAQDGEASALLAHATDVGWSSYSSLATTLVDQPDTAPSESRGAATESAWSLSKLVHYRDSLKYGAWSDKLIPFCSKLQDGRLVLGTSFSQVKPDSTYQSVGHLGGEVLAAWLADFSTRTDGTIANRLSKSLQEVMINRFQWPGTLSMSSVICDGGSCAVLTRKGAWVKLQLGPPLAEEEVRKFWKVVESGRRPVGHEQEDSLEESLWPVSDGTIGAAEGET